MATAPHQITYVFSAVNNLTATTNKIQGDTARLAKQFTKLSGAIQNSFQFYVRYRIFSLINAGISALEGAIPGLIARGQEWAQTVDNIADSSGLAAEKSSLLAGAVMVMTGDAEGLTKALGALSQQAVNHGDVMERYGIKTRDANGQLLDTWSILQNVRKATSDLGNGFITTAAARDLFSRGGQTLMDFLTMSDKQFRMLTKDVKASGVIMSDAALQAADQWGRTQQRFQQQITGISNQIVSGVQPLLSRLVDGITNYLRQNMASIVGFVVSAVSFVAGAVAGFLGIDIGGQVKTFAEAMDDAADKTNKRERQLSKAAKTRQEQSSTEDGYTRALNRQIEAIDRQLAAMAKADSAEDARREHARLMRDIADAQKELRDLRGEGIFAAGMSNAEAELARQAQAADIIEAQKKVKEAQKAAAEHARDTRRDQLRTELQERKAALQKRLADHVKMLAEQAQAEREVLSQVLGDDKSGIGGMPKNIAKEVKKAVKGGLLNANVGQQWGQDFRSSLEGFFDDLNDPTTGLGASFETLKSAVDAAAPAVVALGAAIVVNNVVGTIANLGIAAKGVVGAIGLAGAVGGATLLGAVGLAVVAFNMWSDALDGWFKQGKVIQDTRERQTDTTQADRQGLAQGQINIRQKGGGAWTGLGRAAYEIFGGGKGTEERSLANAIGDALADKTVTKGELRTYNATVNELIGLMAKEGRGGEAWDELLEQQRLLNAAVGEGGTLPTMLADIGAGIGPQSALALTLPKLATAMGEEGPLAQAQLSAAATSQRLAPYGGRTIAQHLWQVASNTRALSTTTPWGVANITLNIDGRTAARLAGVPIRKGTSTTRIQPAV